ncbi:MAG: DUF3999 domain-containing protein [Planctomycetes bacterium]|nr:DUF3999 domain-containing protein [Planctomycetota bacterium]
MELDSDIYAVTRDGLPDIRVLDDAAQEVPYVLEKVTVERKEPRRKPVKSFIESLREKPGNRIEVQVRLEEAATSADGFTIVTPQRNFERTVTVLGSRDGQSWQTLVSSAVIFDYSRYLDVSHYDVPLPENDCRQYRLVIEEVTLDRPSPLSELTRRFRGDTEVERLEQTQVRRETFRIDRLKFWRTVIEQRVAGEKKKWYGNLDWEQVAANDNAKTTVIEVPTRREPLTGLQIETASRNFSRRAEIQTAEQRSGKTRWRAIGHGRITRIQFRDFRREQLLIRFDETRRSRYRIVIFNDDNPPLQITGIRAQGSIYRVVFLAQPDKEYRLVYGAPTVEAPRYDAAAVLGPLRSVGEPVVAELGPQTQLAEAPAEDSILRFRDLVNSVPVLATIIVVLAAALGWALYRASRRIDSLPPD